MAKEVYTFTIGIEPSGESFIDYPISKSEKKLIKKAVDEMIDFDDCEELSELYQKVMDAAKEKLQEDIELTEDGVEVDTLDYWIEFGDEIEEDD